MQNKLLIALAIFSLSQANLSYSYSEYEYSDGGEPSFQAYDNGSNYSFTEASDNSGYYDNRDDRYEMRDEHLVYASNESYRNRNSSSHRHSYKKKRSHRSSLPSSIAAHGEKVIIVDPNVHAWGAYSADGKLLRSGLTTAGSGWCRDLKRPCRTRSGTFRIYSLGSSSCVSKRFPLGRGGAPMPYCMFFNGGQALHGSYEVVAANVSHGCVRMSVDSARWLRNNFAGVGTKVIIRPY